MNNVMYCILQDNLFCHVEYLNFKIKGLLMNEFTFLKRVIREFYKDYECKEASYIMIDKYFNESCVSDSLKESFYKEKVECGEYIPKSVRKLMRSTDFQNWCHEFLYFELQKFESEFSSKEFELFRSIEVEFDFIEESIKADQIKTGIFWTYDYKYASPYNGPGHGTEYIFHAKVKRSSINWFKTFLLYVFDVYGETEKEIRLFENRRVYDLFIEKKGSVLFSDFRYKKCIA